MRACIIYVKTKIEFLLDNYIKKKKRSELKRSMYGYLLSLL